MAPQRAVRRHRRATMPEGSKGSREEARDNRLRTRTVSGGRGAVDLDVEDFTLRAQPIESGGVSGGFPFRQDIGQVAKAIACRDQFAFSDLCRDQLHEREP